MKYLFTSLLLLSIFSLSAIAQELEYTKADSALVVKLLNAAKTERKGENRIFYFGKKFLGLPYVAHTLENGNKEHLIINLHELDCTTFVETVTALALCDKQNARTFNDYCKNLSLIRWRDGKMKDYTSRNHYFTWWAEDNEKLGIVKDIAPAMSQTTNLGAFTAVQTVNINYMTQHPTSYKQLKNHPEFIPVIKKYEDASKGLKFRYIPKKNMNWSKSSALGVIKDGDIVAMLTDSDGLDTRHIGIAFWKGDKLHFLHASSLYHKVLLSPETFYQYEMKQAKHTGIRVFRFVE